MSPLLNIAAISLFSALVWASPHPQFDSSSGSIDASITSNTTLPVVTVTSTRTATIVPHSSTDLGSSTTSSGILTQPTSWLGITAARSGSEIHLLPMNAAGSRMYLGGPTISYCPDDIASEGGCPPGNVTVISLCSMGVLVPGGQLIYVTPEGEVGYTQAHELYMPPGSITCPFTYSKAPGAYLGRLLLGNKPFGANALMACPTSTVGIYQVYLALQNASVPLGNVSQCLGFDPLAADAPGPAAWEYS